MAEICVHCHNPVVRINYGNKIASVAEGARENVFRHGQPRPYPVCSVSPITEEDVEVVEDEDV